MYLIKNSDVRGDSRPPRSLRWDVFSSGKAGARGWGGGGGVVRGGGGLKEDYAMKELI